jgi:hypothetical protein
MSNAALWAALVGWLRTAGRSAAYLLAGLAAALVRPAAVG